MLKKGFTVAVVTDEAKVGGSCTYWAMIPSKVLRHSVTKVMEYNTNPMFREFGDARKLSFQQILKQAEGVVSVSFVCVLIFMIGIGFHSFMGALNLWTVKQLNWRVSGTSCPPITTGLPPGLARITRRAWIFRAPSSPTATRF